MYHTSPSWLVTKRRKSAVQYLIGPVSRCGIAAGTKAAQGKSFDTLLVLRCLAGSDRSQTGRRGRNIKMAARVGSERFPDINGGLPQTKIRETLLPALRQREEILPLCKFEPIHFLQLLCTPCRALPSSPGPARPPTALKGQSGPPDHHSCPQLCTVQVGSSNYATMHMQPPGRW